MSRRTAGSDSSNAARVSGGHLANPERLRSVVITPSDSAARALSSLLATLDSTLAAGRSKGVWPAIMALLCYGTCLLTPFQAAFDSNSMGLWGISYILDAIFLCETATEIHKLRKSSIKGNVSVDPKESYRTQVIAIVVDLLSIVPLELIAAFCFRETWGHMMALLRLNRLLRISKIASYINDWGAQLHTNAMSVHAVKFVVIITIVAHWQTCIWFSLACREDTCEANSWAGNITLSRPGALFPMQSGVERYLSSMYWSIATTTSTGYGDIHPVQPSEKYFAIVSMLCGVLIFGYLFGSIASSLANTDAPRARYAEKVAAARKHMADANLTDELQSRANDYFDYLWSRKSMTYGPDLVSGEPEGLRAEVALRANERMLRESPIFGTCSEGFLRMISLNIKPALYLPGETVVKRGDLCHMIFFIYRGTLEVRDHFGCTISTLTHGNHFGEVPTIMRMRAACDIVAVTVCDLYTLEKSDLDATLEHYEDMKSKLERDAQERIDQAHLQNPAKAFNRKSRRNEKMSQGGKKKSSSIYTPKPDTRKYSLITPPSKRQSGVVKRSAVGSIREGHLIETVQNLGLEEENLAVIGTSLWQQMKAIIMSGSEYMFVFVTFWSVLSVLIVSFEAAFVGKSLMRIIIGYTIDIILLVEMSISIYMAVTSLKVVQQKEKLWLLASIFANLPIDLIFLAAGSSSATVASARLNRLLRWFKLHEHFERMESASALRSFQSTCIKLAIQIFTMVHVVACAWHALLPNLPGKTSTNISAVDAASSSTLSQQTYISSIYWSVATLTSTGYGDVHATSTAQHVLSIFGMLLGQVLFGTTLATVAATLGNAMKTKNEFRSRLDAIKQFFKDHHVSSSVCQRVELYLEHHWLRYHGHVTAERIQGMPQSLQAELCSAQYETMLDSFPLFRQSTEGFSKHLSFQLRRLLVLPGEHIIHRGDNGKEMYFMNRGVVEVLAQDEISVVTQLSKGTFFGEAGMVFAKPRLNSVRALTHCELLVLSRDHLLQASVHYPAITQIVKHVSENKDHFGAITAAVDLNESIAYDPDIECISAIRHKAFVRNLKHPKRTKKTQVHPTDDILVQQDEQGVLPKETMDDEPAPADLQESNKTKFVLKCVWGIAECCGTFLMPYTLVPMSRVAEYWEVVVTACAILSSFTVLFQAAFLFDSVKLLVFHYFLDFIFLLDMYIKFHTAYTDQHGILVTNQRSTAMKYAKTNFWVDAIASFPFEMIVAGLSTTETLRALCLCRMNRALRGYRILLYIKNKEQCITQNTFKLGLLRFTYITFVVTHWSACIWFIIGCFDDECSEDSWAVSGIVPVTDRAWGHQYLTSLYWAVTTMVSVGYGDIRAHNESEMVYAAFTMLLGTILYGYFIGSIAASIANADYLRSRYQEKLDCLQSFFKRSRVDADVANRVADHFGYLWARNQGIQAQTLFKDLPLALQADVCMDVYREAISKVPLFRNKGLGFMRLLSLVMQPSLHLKGEYVVRVGDFGQEMYFIQRGSVEVVSADGDEIFACMKDGDFFGEISLVFSCPRTASIRAKTNCDLFVLSKRDLDDVLLSFPEISKQIQLEAKMRFSQVKARKRKASSGHDLNASEVSSRSTRSTNSSATISEDEEEKVESSATYGGICVTVTQDAEMDEELHHAGMGPLVPSITNNDGRVARGGGGGGRNSSASKVTQVLTDDKNDDGKISTANDVTKQERCCSDFVSILLCLNKPFGKILQCFQVETPILPNSTGGQAIEIGYLLLVLLLGFTVTFEAAFFAHGINFRTFNILSEVMFSIGISLKFHIATIGENGEPQMDLRAIAADYIWRGSFFVDTLTALPLDISFALFDGGSLKHDRIVSALRVVRLLRLASLTRFFEHHEKKLNTSSVGIRVLKFSIIVTLFTHMVACIWYTIACPVDAGCSNASWIYEQNTTHHQAYADSLYWAMATTTTTGYGDFRAHTNLERAFSIVAMIAGKLIYGFVLGNIASTLANADYLRVCYKEKMAAIDETLIDRSIPDQLRVKVKKYHEYIWKLQNGLDMNSLFSDMPYTLRTDVSWNMGEDLLRQVPLFQQGGSGFVAMLALALRPHYFLKGDWIHKEGDICREIMFVSSGYAEVLAKDRVVQIKHPNSYFGEMDCVTGKPYSVSYRAATDIEALVLTQEELFRTLLHFPEMREVVQRKVGVKLDAKMAYLKRVR